MNRCSLVDQAVLVDSWPASRVDKARSITVTARRLAAERGFDEFTLDELAEAAGVSRRTLFNYFPSKVGAVLGLPPQGCSEVLTQFTAGGPSGHLLQDAVAVLDRFVAAGAQSREHHRVLRRALERNPKLLAATREQFRDLARAWAELIARREGISATHPRAVGLVALITATLEAAVQLYADGDDDRNLQDIVDVLTREQARLFTASPASLTASTTPGS